MNNTQSLKLTAYFFIPLCFLLFNGCGAAWKAKPRCFVNSNYLSRIEEDLVNKPLRVGIVPLAYRDKSVSMKVTDIFMLLDYRSKPFFKSLLLVTGNFLKLIKYHHEFAFF